MNVIYYFDKNEKKKLELLKRKIWTSKEYEYDYTCIQILEEDKIHTFLDIDENILNENYPLDEKKIQIYNFELMLSFNGEITNNDEQFIYYDNNTNSGWSGGPILTKDNLVIGIHKGKIKEETKNFGINIRYIINDIKNKIEKECKNERTKKS